MDDRFNTIAGWVLGAGIVLLGATLVTGELFKAERPETMGYPIAGVEQDAGSGAAVEQPIAHFLQTADAARGEAVFRKCTACHTIAQGGPNGLGPNLFGVMGESVATGHGGYAFSDPLKNHGGTWDWETMSSWLTSPRAFAQGTRMTFAGLSDPQDRADIMVFLNQNGGHLQIPPPPAEAAPAAGAEGNSAGNAAAPAAGNSTEGNTAAPAANAAAPAH
jgi:cytochrome c